MGCYYDRAYAYPHAFNTYFSMYKIASLYPSLITYQQTADTYLLRAYDILHTLYSGHGDTGTGYMGEQTLPDIAAALTAGGHTTEASFVNSVINKLYNAFSASKYPYGSEYSYDNTGEEAVYMAAKQNSEHVGALQGQRQDARLPRPGAGLVLLRRSGHAERRELVAVPVHRRAGRLLHGRLRARASRRRPRSTSGSRTPPRSPTSAPSTRGRSTRTPPTWGPWPGRTRR